MTAHTEPGAKPREVTTYRAGALYNAKGQAVGHSALQKEVVLAFDHDEVVKRLIEQRDRLAKILIDIGHREWCEAAKLYGPCNCDIPAALASSGERGK